MNNQIAISKTLNSREVAEMVGKRHSNLMRDISTYIKYLTDSKLSSSDFFIQSKYLDSKNEERPCYEITKKGCEFIAHKLTGEKGAIFTARYINRFHQMEKQIQKPTCIEDVLIQSLQEMKDMKQQIFETKEQVAIANDTINEIKQTLIDESPQWRKEMNNKVKRIGAKLGDYRRAWNESYQELEKRARCNLDRRLQNMIERMRKAGVPKKQINETGYLDVISLDERLKQIYTSIVKEMAIKYMD